MKVLLISTYDLGRQPFGLASPAAWLRRDGFEVECVDTSRERLHAASLRHADLIGLFVPMHTATRLALTTLPEIRAANPSAYICCYGLYASINAARLRQAGADSIIGGEFEQPLVNLARRVRSGERSANDAEPLVSLERQDFVTPDRGGLPQLATYAGLVNGGERHVTGYTEASRGCKHWCRHCPIVPVYQGKFRVIQREVVLADICRQVEAGAQHITFGDPDFFNGITHALGIVRELHAWHPQLSYDVTIKIEHLLKHRDALPVLRNTGCVLVTSAVESLDDQVLQILDKNHTRADFFEAVKLCREHGLNLSPTFVSFTPWTTRVAYLDVFEAMADLESIEALAPIQLGVRLLVPSGSRLLELPDTEAWLRHFDDASLSYHWEHPDPSMDELCSNVQRVIADRTRAGASRRELFEELYQIACGGAISKRFGEDVRVRATVPYLEEPWFC